MKKLLFLMLVSMLVLVNSCSDPAEPKEGLKIKLENFNSGDTLRIGDIYKLGIKVTDDKRDIDSLKFEQISGIDSSQQMFVVGSSAYSEEIEVKTYNLEDGDLTFNLTVFQGENQTKDSLKLFCERKLKIKIKNITENQSYDLSSDILSGSLDLDCGFDLASDQHVFARYSIGPYLIKTGFYNENFEIKLKNYEELVAGDYYLYAETFIPISEGMEPVAKDGLDSVKIRLVDLNTSPKADFSVSPETGNLATEFVFNAMLSTDNQDPLEDLLFRWDFENDGIFDSEFTSSYTTTKKFTAPGSYFVHLEVKDTDGNIGSKVREITVTGDSTIPIADFTVSPNSGIAGTIFSFDASTSSDDQDPLEKLLFRWDFENDGIFETEFSNNPLVQKSYLQEGVYSVKLEVKDTEGKVGSCIKNVEVTEETSCGLMEGFEGDFFPPDGWSLIDSDEDGYNWIQGTASQLYAVYEGEKAIASASFNENNSNPLYPDNWIITPKVSLTNKDTLRYYVCGMDIQYIAEKYGVFISTTTANPSEFKELFSETLDSKTPGQWHERKISLDEYAGKNVYLAFRHYECSNNWYISIDNVEVSENLSKKKSAVPQLKIKTRK